MGASREEDRWIIAPFLSKVPIVGRQILKSAPEIRRGIRKANGFR